MKYLCLIVMSLAAFVRQTTANESFNEIPTNEIPDASDLRSRRTQAVDSEGESLRLTCQSAAVAESDDETTVTLSLANSESYFSFGTKSKHLYSRNSLGICKQVVLQ